MEVLLQAFLAWFLIGDKWLTLRPGRFTPEEEPRYPLTGEASLDVMTYSCILQGNKPGRPARSISHSILTAVPKLLL